MLLHQRHRAGDGAAVGQAFLVDQRRAHVGHGGNQVVVGEILRLQQRDAAPLCVEPAHIEQAEIGAAAAAGAQNPGADGEAFDIVGGQLARAHSSNSPIVRPTVVTASRTGTPVASRKARLVSTV